MNRRGKDKESKHITHLDGTYQNASLPETWTRRQRFHGSQSRSLQPLEPPAGRASGVTPPALLWSEHWWSDERMRKSSDISFPIYHPVEEKDWHICEKISSIINCDSKASVKNDRWGFCNRTSMRKKKVYFHFLTMDAKWKMLKGLLRIQRRNACHCFDQLQ